MKRIPKAGLVAASAAVCLTGSLLAQTAALPAQGGGGGGQANDQRGDMGAPDGWQSLAAAAKKRALEKTPIPRTADGRPDFTGEFRPPSNFYQTFLLEEHAGGFGVTGGPSMIVDPPDGKIPYTAAGDAERTRRRRPENHWEDNRFKCILMGNPREMLFGFRAYQTPEIFFRYGEREGLLVTRFAAKHELPESVRLWMGDSIASWDGDTLVVDTTNLNGKAWLAVGGDFMSEAAHVVERFTYINHDTLDWQATITDSKTFSRPWTIKYNAPWVRAGRGGGGGFGGGGGAAFDNEGACHEGNVDAAHYYNYSKVVKSKNSAN